ncbi:MAG TPA: cytochrome c oxidase assembly protein [Gammaproteobacteria bacterium]|nr:cytochrome c oxidase assembly protein [Gammaproteobacteria bacterium]
MTAPATCTRRRRLWPRALIAFAAALAAGGLAWGSRPAAIEPIEPLRGPVWTMWDHSGATLFVLVGCVLTLWIYLRGVRWRRRRGHAVSLWRLASYVTGIVLTYLILESPFDALSDHIFWIHRVQHVALHHWIPMLLALSAPIPELVTGLPGWARRHMLQPILRSRGVRGTWEFIQHPVVAPILFVGLIYFWLIPPIFDYATVNETVHEIMHFSMLLEGIPFWWLMLDPKPGRVRYGRRMIILWAVMVPQMLIGAYITFSYSVLYPVYATLDKGWVGSYLFDQHLGGLVVWIPASMMSAVAAFLVLVFWTRRERETGGWPEPTVLEMASEVV